MTGNGRLVVLARHGESELNVLGRVNGDPSLPVALTEAGREQARALGRQIANVGVDLVVHSRFGRTRETALLALGERVVPLVEEPLLDDVGIGELEGATLEEYRAWTRAHARDVSFPGGESLDEAALRFARALEAALALGGERLLMITHLHAIRYALNAAADSVELDGPIHDVGNCVPFLFDEESLRGAARRMAAIATPKE